MPDPQAANGHPVGRRSADSHQASRYPAGSHPAGSHPAGSHPADSHPADDFTESASPIQQPSTDWFADDAFWARHAALLFDGPRWAEVPATVEGILALTGIPPGGRVLDMCCGPGRHAIEFARRGYRVTGVDITEPYLKAARDSAAAERLDAEFIKADARVFERPGQFDLAVNLFTSFGYFDTEEEDVRMATRLFTSLVPGGSLVMEMVGKETAARDFTEGEWFERDGRTILTGFSVVGHWEGLRSRWIIIDGQQRTDRSWVQRLYAATELRKLLRGVGFTQVDLYGSFSADPYGPGAVGLIAHAIKP
jgi:SAM-dependent methyltransferase